MDTATRLAIMMIVLGRVTATHSLAFAQHVRRGFRRLGFQVTGVLSDNGPSGSPATSATTWRLWASTTTGSTS